MIGAAHANANPLDLVTAIVQQMKAGATAALIKSPQYDLTAIDSQQSLAVREKPPGFVSNDHGICGLGYGERG
jgi:hypothetical protein